MTTTQDWENVVFKKNIVKKNIVKNIVEKKPINPSKIAVTKVYYENNTEPDIKPILIDKDYGNKIQKSRLELKMSQEEFAKAICIPKSVIIQYEKGTGIKNSNYVSKINNYINKHTSN